MRAPYHRPKLRLAGRMVLPRMLVAVAVVEVVVVFMDIFGGENAGAGTRSENPTRREAVVRGRLDQAAVAKGKVVVAS